MRTFIDMGGDTFKFFKYLALSLGTVTFSLYMVFGHIQLPQIQVISMYSIVMLGHYLNIKGTKK